MLFKQDILTYTLLTFLAFSMTASAVYILNDIMDREKDRQHPVKRFRPIAAGIISLPFAWILFLLLLAGATGISMVVRPALSGLLLAYFLMNIAYSLKLKHVVIIDVMIIAAGFVMRAYAGALALGLIASDWFILCIFMLSMFLALAKRRSEMILFLSDPSRQRKVLQDYSLELLNQMLSIVTAVSLTSYSLFALQADKAHNEMSMMMTIPFVIYGMMRYLYLIHIKGMGGKPEDVLLRDKGILWTCILFSFVVIFLRDL
ncbi:decaprenyl-phosphate phosphoribosyltransferase [Mitsuokella multacida]|uniref:decaprenyl-phosphate phosphoribosyltransferase n=1 Tax=Mitsuokella multacida TaxID=52226 RepID=UPI0022E61C18|nr:decaprenyl-phosphate phosphoribosyltransferase [Mitsuokella multacida]